MAFRRSLHNIFRESIYGQLTWLPNGSFSLYLFGRLNLLIPPSFLPSIRPNGAKSKASECKAWIIQGHLRSVQLTRSLQGTYPLYKFTGLSDDGNGEQDQDECSYPNLGVRRKAETMYMVYLMASRNWPLSDSIKGASVTILDLCKSFDAAKCRMPMFRTNLEPKIPAGATSTPSFSTFNCFTKERRFAEW